MGEMISVHTVGVRVGVHLQGPSGWVGFKTIIMWIGPMAEFRQLSENSAHNHAFQISQTSEITNCL